ncbi:MAG: glycosyltransferase family 4 protein [Candidatus Omnitrophota bacterium]|jgi:glycosyltransferase involved in cell wall biosynthesis
MRIVLVTTEYVTEEANFDGGLANYTHRAALSLRLSGHEPIVVVASSRREVLMHCGIEVHRVPVIWYNPFFHYFCFFLGTDWILVSYALNREIRAIHRKQRVDVIQYSSLGATALFRVSDIPAVARLSSYQKLADEAHEFDRILKVLVLKGRQYLERAALRRVDAVFGPSRIVGEAVARDMGIEVELIESPFLPDATAMDDAVYREIALELKDRKYLLFFGSIGLLKGAKIIGDMIYGLFERYPDLCFVFVGKDLGLKGCSSIEYLRKQAGKYYERVIYRDKLRHDLLYPIIEHARLVVLPSRFDNFPNTCIEAMAFKKIVIGTRGTSFEELITDAVNGFLCARDSPESLLEVIDSAMRLPSAQCREMGEKAYQRTVKLSPEIIVNKLLSIYTRAIDINRV